MTYLKDVDLIWSNLMNKYDLILTPYITILGVWNFKTKVTLYFLPQYQSSVDFFTTLDVFE